MGRARKTTGFFESGKVAHGPRPLLISPYKDDPTFTAVPLKLSAIPLNTNIAEGHVTGAMLLNLPLKQQGKQIAGVLNALNENGRPLYPRVVIKMSRRSAKTTSIWEVLLGRCVHRPGYQIVMTAQDGQRARDKFREMMDALRAPGVDFEGDRDPGKRLGALYYANGSERIQFDNGSLMWVVPPDPGAFVLVLPMLFSSMKLGSLQLKKPML